MPILVNGKQATPKIGDKRVIRVLDGKDGSIKYGVPVLDLDYRNFDGQGNVGSNDSENRGVWKNLAYTGEQFDATLKDFAFDETNGWTDEGLLFLPSDTRKVEISNTLSKYFIGDFTVIAAYRKKQAGQRNIIIGNYVDRDFRGNTTNLEQTAAGTLRLYLQQSGTTDVKSPEIEGMTDLMRTSAVSIRGSQAKWFINGNYLGVSVIGHRATDINVYPTQVFADNRLNGNIALNGHAKKLLLYDYAMAEEQVIAIQEQLANI